MMGKVIRKEETTMLICHPKGSTSAAGRRTDSFWRGKIMKRARQLRFWRIPNRKLGKKYKNLLKSNI